MLVCDAYLQVGGAEQVSKYLENQTSWRELIVRDEKVLFIPVCYPQDEHWIAVVMWKSGDEHYIRVYNSWEQYRHHDKPLAIRFAKIYHQMCPGTRVRWLFRLPHDKVKQRVADNRCGLYVMARAWQVARGQFLTHAFKARKDIDSIGLYLSHSLLKFIPELCGDDCGLFD